MYDLYVQESRQNVVHLSSEADHLRTQVYIVVYTDETDYQNISASKDQAQSRSAFPFFFIFFFFFFFFPISKVTGSVIRCNTEYCSRFEIVVLYRGFIPAFASITSLTNTVWFLASCACRAHRRSTRQSLTLSSPRSSIFSFSALYFSL